jgi:hypothetical protein
MPTLALDGISSYVSLYIFLRPVGVLSI